MTLDNFSDCLLTETLLWLPLKSVFQCKCISNRWGSLISNPYFTRCYVGHHHKNLQPFTLLFESADILSNRAFTTDSDEPEFKTLASYVHRYNELEDSCNDLLLWRKWPKDEVPGLLFPRKACFFCPGTGGRLLAFDPYITRSCRLIGKPIEYESLGGTDCVGVCQGCLRICQISLWFRLGSVLRVWEFKDYDNEGGGQWFLEHEVFFNQLVSKKSPWLTQYVPLKFPFVTVLAFHPNDGDILYLVIEMKVVLCNLRSKTMEVFCDIPRL
nr:hypothetical protein CFP56_27305 [Quercus suber]